MAGDDHKVKALAELRRDERPRPNARSCFQRRPSLVAELFLASAVSDLEQIAEVIGFQLDESKYTFSAGELGEGSPEFRVEFERNDAPWRERLAAIIEWGRANAPDGVEPQVFVERCMWVDGWTLARGSLKTPLWMEHEEHEVEDLALEMPEVEWLCRSE